MRRKLTSMQRKGGNRTKDKFLGKLVRIWSGEHQAWWGPDRRSYTTVLSEAGIYSFEDAWNACFLACPKKEIEFVTVRE